MKRLIITLYDPFSYPGRKIEMETALPDDWDELDDYYEQRAKCWEVIREDLRMDFAVKEGDA